MKLRVVFVVGMVLGVCRFEGVAQQRGNWRAASKTAQSVTGDLYFSGEKMAINFLSFPVAEIRPLTAAEVMAAFDGADASAGEGHLYRLSVPGEQKFLHKNTLCGGEEVQWMVTFVAGKQMQVLLFSNATPPVFTIEAMNNNSNFCGSYAYSR